MLTEHRTTWVQEINAMALGGHPMPLCPFIDAMTEGNCLVLLCPGIDVVTPLKLMQRCQEATI
jgi:hypothetical protein